MTRLTTKADPGKEFQDQSLNVNVEQIESPSLERALVLGPGPPRTGLLSRILCGAIVVTFALAGFTLILFGLVPVLFVGLVLFLPALLPLILVGLGILFTEDLENSRKNLLENSLSEGQACRCHQLEIPGRNPVGHRLAQGQDACRCGQDVKP